MVEDQSQKTIVKNELTSNLPVTITAVVLGVVVLFALAEWFDGKVVYLIVGVNAVFIPQIYDRVWPESYSTGAAIIWTICAVLVSTGVFIGVLQIIRGSLSVALAALIAFGVTTIVQYGSSGLFARVRQNG